MFDLENESFFFANQILSRSLYKSNLLQEAQNCKSNFIKPIQIILMTSQSRADDIIIVLRPKNFGRHFIQ